MPPPHNVVFDLGGVLAKISHSWQDAAKVSGVSCPLLPPGSTRLVALDAFDEYQADQISVDEYMSRLAAFLGCKPEEALRVHNGIIVKEYPDVLDLVNELHAKQIRTGCLSNTNQPHWEYLALNGSYPAIHSLEMKMASHLVGLNKPDLEIYRLYESQFGLAPNDIAFFDDRQENVDAAVECGWRARQIDPSQPTAAQMREYLGEIGVI